jgi:hypothetical protein
MTTWHKIKVQTFYGERLFIDLSSGASRLKGEFVRRVSVATSAEAWIVDGNYGAVRCLVRSRATHPLRGVPSEWNCPVTRRQPNS